MGNNESEVISKTINLIVVRIKKILAGPSCGLGKQSARPSCIQTLPICLPNGEWNHFFCTQDQLDKPCINLWLYRHKCPHLKLIIICTHENCNKWKLNMTSNQSVFPIRSERIVQKIIKFGRIMLSKWLRRLN